MQSRETLRRHAALVDRMAQTLGIDLEEAAFRGKLSIPDVEDAVLRCTACTQPGACEHWLAARDGATAETTPEYCRNTELFDTIFRAGENG
ncbi:MAG: hypothetical protein KDK26_16435 [Roseivivax sp.]|nr:hypothetical protein [Roseivivax sp.]